MADLTDLKQPGKDNPGGFKTKVFVAPEDWFLSIKKAKVTTDPGDSVTIDGDHTFKTGHGWLELYSTLDAGDFKLDAIGERDGRSFKGTLPLFYPGSDKVAAEQVAELKNKSCIVIVELTDGVYVQCGSEGLGVELVGSWAAAKVSGGRRGWTINGEYYAMRQYFYEGALPLKSVAPAV
ncbi:MAG: hypothetical protein LPK01_04010 [Hymenobacteraceae bacterium]|nr:hypothetical protein [Hymenobacteraceae bacterium]